MTVTRSATLVIAVACFAAGYVATMSTTTSTVASNFLTELEEDTASPTISASNSYGEPPSGYPWTIAEPHRLTTLTLAGVDDCDEWEWAINNVVIEGQTLSEVTYTFRTMGLNKVSATCGDLEVVSSVAVKYVRREIRSLSDADREAFFNAVTTLQNVPTEAGQKVYGEKYFSKDHFTRIHLYYGGTADCDHWHQGAGFVTSHVAFTLMYEQALQAVDPSVAVPYWDFTIESTFYDAETWRESPVFDDDWFGDANPDNEMHTPTEGRFAYVPTMANAWNFSKVTNSYGLLRSPWNNDPTPYMTRHAKVYGLANNLKPSGCSEYHGVLSSDNWMHLSKGLNSAAHGHLHELMGGAWNNNLLDFIEGDVGPAHLSFAHQIQSLSKILWREEFVQCPEYCSTDTHWTDCQCQCTPESIAGLSSYEILAQSGVLESVQFFDHGGHLIDSFVDEEGVAYYTLPDVSQEETQNIYDGLLKMLCSPGHIGDMFQATSPNDITFWVLHPSLDRLWDFKRMAPEDVKYDETWDPYHTCYGHNPDDIQPFKNLFNEDEDSGFYSNQDIYDGLDPKSVHKPYVYDNFEWPHCELAGYAMLNDGH